MVAIAAYRTYAHRSSPKGEAPGVRGRGLSLYWTQLQIAIIPTNTIMKLNGEINA